MGFDRRVVPTGALIASWTAADGWPHRTFSWVSGGGRGSLLFLGGRGDIFEKYFEAFGHWHAAGWSIESFDWRGQGGSGRLSDNPRCGHADDFAPWVDDLAQFYGQWAAAKMSLNAAETDAYCKAVVQADFEEAGDEDVIRKLVGDLNAAGIDTEEAEVRKALADQTVEARR